MKVLPKSEILSKNGDICKRHSGHEARLNDHERRLAICHEDHSDMYREIKDKVSNRFFITLCIFVIGGLGFQLMIYDAIQRVDKKVVAIEATLTRPERIKCTPTH